MSGLYTLNLQCQLITPMFMAGADRRTPELRPSEFKGMMRWWWRAIKAERDYKQLLKEENKIFGGTGKEEGKSKVKIKIKTKLDANSDTKDYPLLPHHSESNCEIDGRKKRNKALPQRAFSDNKKIDFEFNYNNQEIENLIFLTFILGGFGKRSRRGFGSFQIIQPKIQVNLENILRLLNGIANKYMIDNSNLIDNFQVIRNRETNGGNYPWIKEILIGNKAFPNFHSILKNIGKASHDHASASLGNANPRMSSPVYVSVIKNDTKYFPIITVLNSSFPFKYPKNSLNKQKEFIREFIQ